MKTYLQHLKETSVDCLLAWRDLGLISQLKETAADLLGIVLAILAPLLVIISPVIALARMKSEASWEKSRAKAEAEFWNHRYSLVKRVEKQQD